MGLRTRGRALGPMLGMALVVLPHARANTCSFAPVPMTCVRPGQPCTANTGAVVADGRPSGSGAYVAAHCQVSAGEAYNASGIVTTGPGFEDAYGSACTLGAPYQCQFSDPLSSITTTYPGQLACSPTSSGSPASCVLLGKQSTADPCIANVECASGKCVAGVCQGLGVGVACSEGACGTGLFCDPQTNRCAATLPLGGMCGISAQCPHSALCNTELSPPLCQGVFTQRDGATVSSADLCASGIMDSAHTCIDNFDFSLVGQPCDGTSPPSLLPRGYNCYCGSDGQYRYTPVTQRTPRLVQASKDGWSCLGSSKAPDGTSCSNPFAVTPRTSELGSCAYLRCHQQLLEYFAAQNDLLNPPYAYFDHTPLCVQSVRAALASAADQNIVTCALPSSWAANGWNCFAGTPNSGAPSNKLSPGAAFGVSLLVIVLVAGIAVGGYRWRFGAWPLGMDRWLPSFSRPSSYTTIGSTSSTALRTSMASAYQSA